MRNMTGFKRLLAGVLAAVMVLMMAACSSGGASADGDKGGAEPIELVVWQASAGNVISPATEGMIQRFEAAYPNIKVNMQTQPNDNYDQLLKAANLAQNAADVQLLWVGSSTTAYADDLVALNDYLDAEFINERFGWELASEGYDSSKNIYGIPLGSFVYYLWYNKDMLSSIGVTEDNLPTTWDEYLDVCGQLKAAGMTPMVMGTRDGYLSQWGAGALACTLMGADGAKKINEEGFSYVGSEVQTAIEMWQELAVRGYINTDNAEYNSGDEQLQQFVLGKGAFMLGGNWSMGQVLDAMGDNVGIMKIPTADPNNRYAYTNYASAGQNLCVSKYSKHIDEAVAFVKFMASDEQYMLEMVDEGYLPVPNTFDASLLTSEASKLVYGMIQANDSAAVFDCMPHPVFQTLATYGSEIANANISPEEICKLFDEVAAG